MNREELQEAARIAAVSDLISRLRVASEAFALLASAETSSPAGSADAHTAAAMAISVAREILYVALTGELPDGEDNPAEASTAILSEQYRMAIESCIAHVEEADAEAFLDVTWAHPQLGPLNWREWLCFLVVDVEGRRKAAEGPSAASDAISKSVG